MLLEAEVGVTGVVDVRLMQSCGACENVQGMRVCAQSNIVFSPF